VVSGIVLAFLMARLIRRKIKIKVKDLLRGCGYKFGDEQDLLNKLSEGKKLKTAEQDLLNKLRTYMQKYWKVHNTEE
jgi:hypothetical protein